MRTPTFRALAPLMLCVALGGCVSLFPAAKPAQLYRFTGSPPAPASSAPAGEAVVLGGVFFPSDVAGDSILTVTGDQAAFIAGARWVEPASLLFDEALSTAFDAPGSPHLAGRAETLGAASTLRLEVRRFQVDYDKGAGAAPTVEVEIHATLVRNADRMLVADKLFDVRQAADDNRVGAIVAAFSAAVGQTTGAIRDWTAANAPQVRS